MKVFKVNLPDKVADQLEQEAKSIGFDDASQYIQHQMTERVLNKNEQEIEDKEYKEFEEKREQRIKQRKTEEMNDVHQTIDYMVQSLKQAFPEKAIQQVAASE